MYSQFSDFLYAKKDGLAKITFNRPDKLNAVRNKSCMELHQMLDDFNADATARVLLLTGAGRAFSAGVDLSAFDVFEAGKLNEQKAREQLAQFQGITEKLLACDKPVVAAINGIAIGIGLEIALVCDIRIAAAEVRFAFAESKRGLFQTNGVMYILPRLIGWGRASELMLTARTIDAREALAIGMVSRIAPAEQFESVVDATIEQLLNNAPISLRLIKQVGRKALAASLPEVMQMETEGMISCLKSEDLQEGLQAFAEKRKPIYTGK